MAFGIKGKIRLGTLFLFFLLVLSGGTSIFYFSLLKKDTQLILKANYESLIYCHAMQQQLGNLKSNPDSVIKTFEENLKLQENNITEPGEKEATANLRLHFEKLKAGSNTDTALTLNIRNDLQQILNLNMRAMKHKNTSALNMASKATTWLTLISVLVFIIAFIFSVNFPSVISNPISQLKEAVKEIANKNYKHRIHINNKDEFGDLANAFNSLAQKLDEYESSNLNKLMFEKARAEAVINSLKDASIGIDQNNNILFTNQQALNLLGLKATDILGKPVNEVISRNDLFRFLMEKNHSSPFKIVIDNKESYFTKETNTITKGNEELGVVITLKNITGYLEKDVAKTNFLATISHELKTPLASSDIGLKLLQNEKTGTINPQQKEIISDLQKDNQRLIKIVSELLDLSQAETGNINLSIEPVNVREVIEFAVNSMHQQANDKQIAFEIAIEDHTKPILADKEKAIWVLINLLSNAIRYSPTDDKIIITAKNNNNSKVEISVKDNGPGIQKEYAEKIFQRFFQVPNTLSLYKGTGLGLSISKEFMTAMGGNIFLKNAGTTGSEFCLQYQSAS